MFYFRNSHSEAIQCLAYNPVSMHLASCAISDFAFWSADVKAVQKYRVSGRITSCAWSLNGQHLAIGLASGAVSIRDKVSMHFKLVECCFSKSVLFLNGSLTLLRLANWSLTIIITVWIKVLQC